MTTQVTYAEAVEMLRLFGSSDMRAPLPIPGEISSKLSSFSTNLLKAKSDDDQVAARLKEIEDELKACLKASHEVANTARKQNIQENLPSGGNPDIDAWQKREKEIDSELSESEQKCRNKKTDEVAKLLEEHNDSPDIITQITEWLADVWERIVAALKEVWEAITNFFNKVLDAIISALEYLADLVNDIANSFAKWVTG